MNTPLSEQQLELIGFPPPAQTKTAEARNFPDRIGLAAVSYKDAAEILTASLQASRPALPAHEATLHPD